MNVQEIVQAFDPGKPLTHALTIPGLWYTDERIADLERKSVFSRTWQMVGRAEQVAAPGQYITAEVAGEPVLVVRGQDGALRGFFNVCRHHAAAVMTEACGTAARLQCPYHGWTYGLDGSLRGVPDFEKVENFDRKQNGLVPLGVDIWEKFVFVHLDPDPIGLREFLGEMVGHIKPLGLGQLHYAGRREWIIDCN
jgi:choline monooxygenase